MPDCLALARFQVASCDYPKKKVASCDSEWGLVKVCTWYLVGVPEFYVGVWKIEILLSLNWNVIAILSLEFKSY